MNSRFGVSRWLPACGIFGLFLTSVALAQTNPTPLGLPLTQNWGTGGGTVLPTGFEAWAGLSGASITTQALAEASNANSNGVIINGAPGIGGTGACYLYAPGSNARFAILTSSNAAGGVDQLAMALDTTGQSGITIAWDFINAVASATRGVGSVVQYRIGTSGGWTTLSGTNNPYFQIGGTSGDVTAASVTLPGAAENQPVVQVRWATWRATGTSSSSGYAIDNINVTASSSSLPAITSVDISDGPGYDVGDSPALTVTLASAPATSATVSVASGAFATTQIVINAPDTTGQTDIVMANPGTFTATATPVSGCSGSAVSSSFTVTANSVASFAAAGGNVVNDAAGNNNSAIDPSESNIQLTLPIINNGTVPATSVSATLTSLTSGVTVNSGTRSYPNIGVSATASNVLGFIISTNAAVSCGSTITLQLAVTSNEGSSSFNVNFTACPLTIDQYDPPSDYYTTATGLGATLKTNLHNIIKHDYWNGFFSSSSHRVRSYDDARVALQLLDRDPNNANNVLLLYTNVSVPKAWDGGNTWNREHQWPQSLGVGSSGPAFSDLNNLRPCDQGVNSSRGNSPYGIGPGYWDPDHGQVCRGRAARSLFYMNTRYNGDTPSNINLVLVNGQPSGSTMGDLAKLIEWHYAYPPDAEERRRNATLFSNSLNPSYYQGNRNPYIDHPEYVWTIYGTSANDSKLYLGGSAPADGASNAAVNLGALIVGASQPTAQTLTLNKSGVNPTTYDVTVSGLADSNAAGPRQAFVAGAQSRMFTAGLSTTTATAGLKSGSISFDNTELSSSTNGTGSADGNDVVSISETVLDHANGSFATPTDQNTLTINFGNVTVGGGAANQNFTVYNLTVTPGYTAALNLNSISGSGDTTKLTTNFTAQSGIAAGGNHLFTATLTPDAVGNYSATYTIVNADETLPGAAGGTNLVLTLTANVVNAACNPYDVNCDTVVNAADVATMVARLLSGSSGCSACAGDANGDLTVDGKDIQLLVNQLLTP